MGISLLVLQQVLVMACLMIFGAFLVRVRVFDDKGISQMSNFVLLVIMPCLIINSFQVDFEPSMLLGFGLAAALGAGTYILSILLCTFVLLRGKEETRRIERLSAIYSNVGYFAIPVINATMGPAAMLYATAYIAMFNIFSWTHGLMDMQNNWKEVSFRKIITAPGVWASLVGCALFVLRVRLPIPIGPAVKYLAELNTPLAMMICGAFMAHLDWRSFYKDLKIYKVAIIRLLAIPLLMIAIFWALRIDTVLPNAKFIIMVSLIGTATPSAISISLMAHKYGLNGQYAGEIITVTNLLSILTLPLVVLIAQLVFRY